MQQLQAIIAHAWSDPGYKQRLQTKPASILAEAGIHIPAGREIKVLTDDAKTVHLVRFYRNNRMSSTMSS